MGRLLLQLRYHSRLMGVGDFINSNALLAAVSWALSIRWGQPVMVSQTTLNCSHCQEVVQWTC